MTTVATGATAYGAYATAQTANTTAIGFRSLATLATDTAIGYQSQATGEQATAIGANSLASGSRGVALGAGAQATGANSVAIGSGSVANEANTASVGSAGNARRITNVAPGINANDAATVGQVNDLGNFTNNLARNAYSGIAGATALSMIPQLEPGQNFSIGLGFGGYKGFTSVAAGATARFSEHIVGKAGIGVGTRESSPTYGFGASYSW